VQDEYLYKLIFNSADGTATTVGDAGGMHIVCLHACMCELYVERVDVGPNYAAYVFAHGSGLSTHLTSFTQIAMSGKINIGALHFVCQGLVVSLTQN